MAKVLHIINGEFFAGAERVQDLLSARLPDFGYQCDFVCLKEGQFEKVRKSGQGQIFNVAMRSRFDFSVVNRICDLVRTRGYVLLHTHTARGAMVGRLVAAKTGIPFVHHVHSPTARDTENRLRNWLNVKIEAWALRSASQLIPVSASLAAYLHGLGYKPDVVSVVPNGVPAVPVGLYEARQSPEPWRLGMVALFRPRKGLEVMLKSLAHLNQSGLSCHLHAVGSFETPDYEAQIKSLCKGLGMADKVTWTGFCSDVAAQFPCMDLFVLPSLFGEGLPMVLIEAMAAGLPVIGTRVEGIPEVVANGCGLLVEPDDVGSLAEGITAFSRLSQDERRLMAMNGRNRQQAQFSDVSMASGVAAIYEKVLGQAHLATGKARGA